MTLSGEDHIVALATSPGQSAVALIRVSGPDSLSLFSGLFEPRKKSVLEARRPCLGLFSTPQGTVLDEVLVTWFPEPASYTGESLVEVSCHGSLYITRRIIELLLAAGARLAQPGEFTKRAFLNGKLDLAQAEAVRDLVESQTAFQARLAADQLGGRLSRRLRPLQDELIEILSHMETTLEFVDDDVEPESRVQLCRRLEALDAELSSLEESFQVGRLIRAGIEVAITGAPNAGKSSIFNSLVKNDRALVTPLPGTTRDAVTEVVSIRGLPARLIDTAGIRQPGDPIEELGIKKSREYLSGADVVLFVLDSSSDFGAEEREIWQLVRERQGVLVFNKNDLPSRLELPGDVLEEGWPQVSTSALQQRGLEELVGALWEQISPASRIERERFFLTNIRHHEAVRAARESLGRGVSAYRDGLSEEFPIYDLRKCLESLGVITGEVSVDDILERIFSSFCIGK